MHKCHHLQLNPVWKELWTGNLLKKTSNACQSTAGNWIPQTGSFPQSIDAQHANFPSECNLYRNRESVWESIVCVFSRCCWKKKIKQHPSRKAPCSRPGSSSTPPSWPVVVQELPSSTHHWPGSPYPGWPQGRGSSGWPHRASWGGRWQLSWRGQSPGSSECSQTSPQCYWASGPVEKRTTTWVWFRIRWCIGLSWKWKDTSI